MSLPSFRIESLHSGEQFDRAVALQDEVWSYDEANRMTQKVFLLAAHIGGQVLGAYDDDRLAGYAMALPGIRDGRAYLHSHHLAVLPQYRNGGVGRRLKLAQRDDALARGIQLMEWTFDPLETRNAHLNIHRLGAIVRRYKRNFYGESSSPLHGALPTDRIIAEWWLANDRVKQALAGEPADVRAEQRIVVPGEVAAWKIAPETRGLARDVQEANAVAFEQAFAGGLAVLGFERGDNGDGVYLLGRPTEDYRLS